MALPVRQDVLFVCRTVEGQQCRLPSVMTALSPCLSLTIDTPVLISRHSSLYVYVYLPQDQESHQSEDHIWFVSEQDASSHSGENQCLLIRWKWANSLDYGFLKTVVWMKADENEHWKTHGVSALHRELEAAVESWEQEKCLLQAGAQQLGIQYQCSALKTYISVTLHRI